MQQQKTNIVTASRSSTRTVDVGLIDRSLSFETLVRHQANRTSRKRLIFAVAEWQMLDNTCCMPATHLTNCPYLTAPTVRPTNHSIYRQHCQSAMTGTTEIAVKCFIFLQSVTPVCICIAVNCNADANGSN